MRDKLVTCKQYSLSAAWGSVCLCRKTRTIHRTLIKVKAVWLCYGVFKAAQSCEANKRLPLPFLMPQPSGMRLAPTALPKYSKH